MVAFTVARLVLGGDLGQAEGTPVGEAADNATAADNLGTSIPGDPIRKN